MKPDRISTFLLAFSVAAAAMGLLCWQLWRHREDKPSREEQEAYQTAKMKAELGIFDEQAMTVADLIHLLQQHDPRATVVLWDHEPHEGQVSKVGFGEVQPIQLGARESNGLLLLEPWVDAGRDLQGPFPGVVLGSS